MHGLYPVINGAWTKQRLHGFGEGCGSEVWFVRGGAGVAPTALNSDRNGGMAEKHGKGARGGV